MNDLIDKLKLSVGITDEQAIKAIEVIKNFTKEKFPMFGGAIDELFSKHSGKEENDPLD